MPQQHSAPKTTARDFFWYLLMIVTLYISVVSFLGLLFKYVNLKFPDALSYYWFGEVEGIRTAMAALIVAWPVYLFLSRLINRDIDANPEKHDLKVRKWLLYLTLFIAAITIIVDLITLIHSFLSGELTTRFLLKVLAVLVTAAATFGYYLWDIKRDPKDKTMVPKQAALGASAVAILTIAAGFLFAGSPMQQREMRFDETRTQNLQSIQYEVVNYWQTKRELPPNLASLTNSLTGYVAPTDPQTMQPYEYAVKGPLSFQLCANFGRPSQSIGLPQAVKPATPYPNPNDPFSGNWEHQAGRVCFDRTIDPTLYPKPETVPPVR